MVDVPIGPYMNEDGDWWVPATVPFRRARAEIVSCVQYSIPEEGTLRYEGKQMQWLDSEHEGYCGEDCPMNRHVEAWHFVENPRW